jgi:hypothetical protein
LTVSVFLQARIEIRTSEDLFQTAGLADRSAILNDRRLTSDAFHHISAVDAEKEDDRMSFSHDEKGIA